MENVSRQSLFVSTDEVEDYVFETNTVPAVYESIIKNIQIIKMHANSIYWEGLLHPSAVTINNYHFTKHGMKI